MTVMLCSNGADKSNEAGVGDVSDTKAQQEPVPEHLQFVARRHLVARAEERDQRDLRLLVAVVEYPLIVDLQQCVQDRAACLEDLVEEDEFGLDKFAGRATPVLVPSPS